ncbi:MAG: cytochrome c biogenesis protein ResB [Deltaproteobacteria bacterium]|nr:cytochrome c biogenesis protein ResB [Deltaproteobacteria bacterium]
MAGTNKKTGKAGVPAGASLYLYRKLSSLRVSVYLLGVLTFFYGLGTVFPQGAALEEYSGAGGKVVAAVRLFNLLDIFNTPWFLVPAFVLFLNVLVCTYDRFFTIRARKKTLPETFPADCAVTLDCARSDVEEELPGILRGKLGFRVLSKTPGWTVLEKGLSYRWLTWLYHAALAASFAGFILSGLFVREGMVTLRPGKPAEVVSAGEKLGWLEKEDHAAPDFRLVLDAFITAYTQSPSLEYPTDKRSRLAYALGWKGLSYKSEEDSFFPKDWFSKLRVLRGGATVSEKTIEVNDPLKFEGYTFYQAAYEQTLRLRVKGSPSIVEAKAGEKIKLPGMEGEFLFGTLRVGTLNRLDGTVEKIIPFTTVKKITDAKESAGKGMRLTPGNSVDIDGRTIELVDFEEASVLSYRYDPGVPVLWVAGSLVFIVMALRCFGRWYMLAYTLEDTGGRTLLKLHIRAKGLSADPERIKRRLLHCLSNRA